MAVSTAIPAATIGSVYRDAWRIYRRHPGALLVPGAVLFGVFGLPSALLSETTTKDGLLAVLLSFGAQTLGWISSFVYYGYCEEVTDQARTGEVSVRRALAETRPVLLKLMWVSVIVEVLVAFGLVLLIVPGILLAARWALVAPIASFEGAWPRRAMKRSRDLVRGHFWLIMATAVAMFVAEQVVSTVLDALGEHIGSHPTIGGAIGDALGDLLVAPWAGMVIAIVYFGLSGRGEPMPATGAAA